MVKPVARLRAGDNAYKLYGRGIPVHLMIRLLVAETLLSNHVWEAKD
jgi:hypothetical protein